MAIEIGRRKTIERVIIAKPQKIPTLIIDFQLNFRTNSAENNKRQHMKKRNNVSVRIKLLCKIKLKEKIENIAENNPVCLFIIVPNL